MSLATDVVFYFASNAETMIATKALKDAGIAARMIPKPAQVASASNLCISIASNAESLAKAALSGAGIVLGGTVN